MKEFNSFEDRIEWQFEMTDLMNMIRNDTNQVVWYRTHIADGTYDSVVGLNRFVQQLELNIMKMKMSYEAMWDELSIEQKHYYAFVPYNMWPYWL